MKTRTHTTDIPNFAAWGNENLAAFSKEAYVALQNQAAEIEWLRLHLKAIYEFIDASKIVHETQIH
jgi:hypothetical protein